MIGGFYDHAKFIESVTESFENYTKFGKRSSRKVSPIHNYLADVLNQIFGDSYEVFCMDRNREFKVTGKYYNKNVDITVTKNGSPVFCLGVKFITSNYKQNANNYFESMLGETANVQAVHNVPYAHLIIFRKKTPYFDSNGNIKKMEILSDSDMRKYIKLMFDLNHLHKPFGLGITIVDSENGTVAECNYSAEFEEAVANILNNNLSNRRLFQNVLERKIYLDYKNED